MPSELEKLSKALARASPLTSLCASADGDAVAAATAAAAQFRNVTRINGSEAEAAVAALLNTTLRHFELRDDAVAGRRHLGVLPADARHSMPSALVRRRAADAGQEVAVDPTHVLMRGILATQALGAALRNASARTAALVGTPAPGSGGGGGGGGNRSDANGRAATATNAGISASTFAGPRGGSGGSSLSATSSRGRGRGCPP